MTSEEATSEEAAQQEHEPGAPREQEPVMQLLPSTSAAVIIGQLLRNVRHARGLNQRELAEQVGMSKSGIARLESGTGEPRLRTALAVLESLGLSVFAAVPPGLHGPGPDAGPSGVRDAQGRRHPAHCEATKVNCPPTWWFVRNPHRPRTSWPAWSFTARPRPRPPDWLERQRRAWLRDQPDDPSEDQPGGP